MQNWLYKRASLTPNRIAFITEEGQCTFAELNKRAVQMAYRFGTLGIKKGDHIAILAKNNLRSVLVINALHYIGAVIIFLNNRLTSYELLWQIKDSDAKMLIYDPTYSDKVNNLKKYNQLLDFFSYDELSDIKQTKVPLQFEIDLESNEAIIYTSGTTGYPKGVMLTYGNHWWSAIASSLNLGLYHEDCWLACVPIYHVSGLSILMRGLIYGIPVVLQESFNPELVNYAIFKRDVTIVSVVSAMLTNLLEDLGTSNYPEKFRCMLLGGGPVPYSLLQECKAHRVPVFQTYGMTETASQIATLAPEYMLKKMGSAGKALFPVQLKIENNEIPTKPGEVGEIVVKGPNVTKGYYNRPEQTEKTIQDGWLYTGDIGYFDEDGFLYILDRRTDLIISGGENVYPAEIETVLLSHEAIEDAGVTGIKHEKWGEVPVAFVKIRDGRNVNEKQIIAFCEKRLARYKVPVSVYFVNYIPRNASKKLLRRKLLELI